MDEAPKMFGDSDGNTTALPQSMVPTPALRSSDVVVAIMGVSGSGKSTFVSELLGEKIVVVGHSLQSETKVTSTYEFRRPGQGSIYVVDTPGFDDTYVSDAEVLRDIAAFMSKTYQSSVKLAGIIYLHRITDNRVSGSALRNLRMFKELCGQDAYKHVVLVTSMWDRLHSNDEEKAIAREKELIGEDGFWKDMHARGSPVKRWYADSASANAIIDGLLAARNSNGDATLQIQRELVEEGKELASTSAGREVNKKLAELEKCFAKEMEELMESSRAAIAEGDIKLHKQLQIDRRDFEEQQRRAAEGQRALQVNFQALLDNNAEKYLVELCNIVSRDLAYLENQMEDATAALRGTSFYHIQWADEVRKTAARSLNQVNSYIASKISATAQPLFKPQDLSTSSSNPISSDVLKDVASVAAMQQQLAIAHTAMVGVMGQMRQLAIQRDAATKGQGENQSVQPEHSTSSSQSAD